MAPHRAWMWMAALATVFICAHFAFGWQAFRGEAFANEEIPKPDDYLIQWARDTFENWQSEFIQLAVQFAVLAGVLKWIGLKAYEEDQEQIRDQLTNIQESLDLLNSRTDTIRRRLP